MEFPKGIPGIILSFNPYTYWYEIFRQGGFKEVGEEAFRALLGCTGSQPKVLNTFIQGILEGKRTIIGTIFILSKYNDIFTTFLLFLVLLSRDQTGVLIEKHLEPETFNNILTRSLTDDKREFLLALSYLSDIKSFEIPVGYLPVYIRLHDWKMVQKLQSEKNIHLEIEKIIPALNDAYLDALGNNYEDLKERSIIGNTAKHLLSNCKYITESIAFRLRNLFIHQKVHLFSIYPEIRRYVVAEDIMKGGWKRSINRIKEQSEIIYPIPTSVSRTKFLNFIKEVIILLRPSIEALEFIDTYINYYPSKEDILITEFRKIRRQISLVVEISK